MQTLNEIRLIRIIRRLIFFDPFLVILCHFFALHFPPPKCNSANSAVIFFERCVQKLSVSCS